MDPPLAVTHVPSYKMSKMLARHKGVDKGKTTQIVLEP